MLKEIVMASRKDSITFRPGKIGKMKIKNRLVRSATFEKMGTDKGEVTGMLVDLYRTLAMGGVGLIITGHTAVHPEGHLDPKMLRITEDSFIPGLNKISNAVHDVKKDCKIVLQLNHAGRQQVRPELGIPAVAPSAVFDVLFQRIPRELTIEEIDEIIDCFAEAIRRAKDAEFDGAQLHAAHGWLLSSFLSPYTNRRDDKYGGTTEKRVRVLQEIYERARKKVGEEFPILIKLNTADYMPGGVDLEEAKRIARYLSRIGFSAIEISSGMWEAMTRTEKELGWKPVPNPEARVGITTREQEAYFWANAKAIKKEVDLPIILVGGIRSIDKVEEILNEGSVDFCAMSRPFIREPDLPICWLMGTGSGKAKCISCNRCLPKPGRPLECRVNEQQNGSIPLLNMFPYFRKSK